MKKDRWIIFLPLIIILGLLPQIPGFPCCLATDVIIFGLFAMAYNLLFGYTGIITFGHSVFFGLGAYGAGVFLIHSSLPPSMISLFVGAIAATVAAALIGGLALRRKGIYMSMITLAFNEIFYFIVWSFREYTGGYDGLLGIKTPPLEIPYVFSIPLMNEPLRIYYFCLAVFIVCILVLRILVKSPFGLLLQLIRENEERARFLGYDVDRYKLISFILSGLFSGVAGSLHAIHMCYVGPDSIHWMLSGEVNVMCLLGGMTTFLGPLLGAAIYLIAKEYILSLTLHWPVIVGLLFVVTTLWLRQGILGRLQTILKKTIEL